METCVSLTNGNCLIYLQTSILWDNITDARNKLRMGANHWLSLSYNQSLVIDQPKLLVFVMPHSHADPGKRAPSQHQYQSFEIDFLCSEQIF